MPLIHHSQLDPFLSDRFVETGTYHGDGVRCAIAAGFPDIRSIELDSEMYLANLRRFAQFPSVRLFYGDSGSILYDVAFGGFGGRCTFWLDGHYSGPGTAKGEEECPLLKELAQIARHQRNDHVLLIDDVRLFGRAMPTLDEVETGIARINPNYRVSFIDGIEDGDILVAQTEND